MAGFVNMLSDGILTAFIPWLEVLPEYQRQGIGDELMRRVLADTDRFYSVDLVCDAELLPYYARFGMASASGALLRHPAALADLVPADPADGPHAQAVCQWRRRMAGSRQYRGRW